MKCAWIGGTVVVLAGVVVLALAPFVVPEPMHAGVAPALSRPAQGDMVFTAAPAEQSEAGDTTLTPSESQPRELGRLFVNAQGKLEFRGNAEASAQAFFEQVARQWNERSSAETVVDARPTP